MIQSLGEILAGALQRAISMYFDQQLSTFQRQGYTNDLLIQIHCQRTWLGHINECEISSYYFVLKEKVREEEMKMNINYKHTEWESKLDFGFYFSFSLGSNSLCILLLYNHNFRNKNTITGISTWMFHRYFLIFRTDLFKWHLSVRNYIIL